MPFNDDRTPVAPGAPAGMDARCSAAAAAYLILMDRSAGGPRDDWADAALGIAARILGVNTPDELVSEMSTLLAKGSPARRFIQNLGLKSGVSERRADAERLLGQQVRHHTIAAAQPDPPDPVRGTFWLWFAAQDQIAVFVMHHRHVVPARHKRPRHALNADGVTAKGIGGIKCGEHQNA